MKKLLLIVVIILVSASFVFAQNATMAGKKHDFRAIGTSSIEGPSEKLCGYCHTPHVPSTGIKAPLWSRQKLQTNGIVGYTNSAGVKVGADLGTENASVSGMCMSCHDGSTFLAASKFVKRPWASTSYAGDAAWDANVSGTLTTGTVTVGNSANLHGGTTYGAGLSHTHPVNFSYATYDAAKGYNSTPLTIAPNGTGTAVAAKLYGGTVQCGSCHDPHLSGKMTRNTTDHAALCISCHIK